MVPKLVKNICKDLSFDFVRAESQGNSYILVKFVSIGLSTDSIEMDDTKDHKE